MCLRKGVRSWSAECGCAAKPVVVGSGYTRVEALRLMHDMYKIPEPDTKQKISQTLKLVIRNSCAKRSPRARVRSANPWERLR